MKREEDDIRKELEEISPFLSKMKKENPFEVPYGYFDKMQREVLEKTLGEKRSAQQALRGNEIVVSSYLTQSFVRGLRPPLFL